MVGDFKIFLLVCLHFLKFYDKQGFFGFVFLFGFFLGG